MKNTYRNFILGLIEIDRFYKNLILFLIDYLILLFSFYFSLSIRINGFFQPNYESLMIMFITPIFALPILYLFGQYSSLIRFISLKSAISSFMAITLFTLIIFLLLLVIEPPTMPLNFILIFWMTSLFLLNNTRYIIRWSLTLTSYKDNVLIYGAGTGGIQVASALIDSNKFQPIAIIDDNKKLQGKTIGGLRIISSDNLSSVIKKRNIKEVFLAMPSVSRSDTTKLINKLKINPVKIRVLPGVTELAEGKVLVSDLKQVKIGDLLNREIVKPDEKLLIKDIDQKSILVTGAGGSIGSEICRQIIKLNPKRLVLFDISEASLYLIEHELRDYKSDVIILAIIGNVTRRNRLDYILKKYEVDTIYHTAAYKHVPLVEKNTIPGIRCNIFGTLTTIKAAINADVASFVFISTDKAVRPTNAMGATKRFAELILQSLAKENQADGNKSNIRISMVRFGNVLGSSGSVVPLFKKQIKQGGPLTVTDPNVIRFFMTIPEAAQLVIQAGAMGKVGDIFLLNMGEPVHVLDLAKDMIRLSGMTIKDHQNPDGDIEIIFTGLRPGEKLVEELLIDNRSDSTQHKKIMRANERGMEWNQLSLYISRLEKAIEISDFKEITDVFTKTVSGYSSSK
jgi:UDP-N-acetylglucosamine 4,6-dehydratase